MPLANVQGSEDQWNVARSRSRQPVRLRIFPVNMRSALGFRENSRALEVSTASLPGCLKPTVAPLAGPGKIADSTPSLGSKGVRDTGKIMAKYKVQPYDGPVYVADHYRALADIVLRELMDTPIEKVRELHPRDILSALEVNDMLNFEDEEIDLLVEEHLRPLGSQLQGIRKDAFDGWLPTVVVLP